MLLSLREAEVSRASRTRPFPFRGHLYPRPEGSWLSGASSEGAWTSGWGREWPEQPRFISFQTCPLLGSIMALLVFPVGPHLLLLDPNSYWASTLCQSHSLHRV